MGVVKENGMRGFFGLNAAAAALYAVVLISAFIAGYFDPVFVIVFIGMVFHAGLAVTDRPGPRRKP